MPNLLRLLTNEVRSFMGFLRDYEMPVLHDPTCDCIEHVVVFDPAVTVLVGGQRLVSVHAPEKCAGEACCIHNPSDHHMAEWPQNWRGDRRLMERVCPHGVGHPDPDDPSLDTVHGCDGCCVAA